MGSPSVSTRRGLVHWQGLLLVVSLLTFWSPPTTDTISVVSTYAPKGENAYLHICNKPPEAVGFVWYKGKGVNKNNIAAFSMMTSNLILNGPENNGSAIVSNDGSLLLKKVTMNDTGVYTVVVHLPDSETEVGSGELHVYEQLRVPVLLASSHWVLENEDDVVLTCYTNGLSIQWLFNGMDLQFTDRMKLTADGRRLTIHPVKREDAGVYKCKTSNLIMKLDSRYLELHVIY